jgi:GMP synthase (glutamine-hydrolysing)
MQKSILIVLHQENSTPGRIGNALGDLGYHLDVRRPRFDDPLPETMAEHAAAIIFGGPMSANDQDEFIQRETAWIGVPLRESKPFLGICLGAQMFANHLGGKVTGRAMAAMCLSMAPRGFRRAARCGASGRRRYI